MAYKQVPDLDAKENDILDFLKDTASRKEFLVTRSSLAPNANSAKYSGYNHEAGELVMPGMRLHGAQHFIRAFHNPNSQIDRILIEWQTGSGKSICVISVAHEYIKQFREIHAIGVKPPTVTVISFSVRETIQEDLLKYPEFGIVSHEEAENLKLLKAKAGARNANIADSKTYSAHVGTLRRRITDAERGGYYRFYGYKEFANTLFKITAEGAAIGFDIQQLYRQDAENFDALLNVAVEKGFVVVDNELINSMRHGLMICDEIHDVYNISETNNYGIAIQYVLDKLGKTAPRAVFMSATPITGSAAEIIGLLNLLVPRHRLPGERPLKRSDFFTRSKYQEIDTFSYNGVTYSLKKFINIGKKQKFTNVKVNKLVITPETINGGDPIAVNIKNLLILVSGADIINHLISSKIDYTDIKVVPANAVESAEENDDIEAAELADLSSQFVISHLKEGAIEKISQLAAGRVSFLLDADVSAYPRRYFVGENIPDVPYLSITKCPMSEFHEATIKQEHGADGTPKPANSGFNAISYTLYDIAFPNPSNASYGLYLSSDTFNKIDSSSADWKVSKGIHINRRSDEIATISGEFLKMENLKTYSTKYYELIKAVLDVIKAGPGKIMIYHHRVRMSGVLLLQEAFKMNGFIDEFSNPVDTTICAICGLRRSEHFKLKSESTNVEFNIFDANGAEDGETTATTGAAEDDTDEYEMIDGYILPKGGPGAAANISGGKDDEKHEFTPARFVVAHSDVDRAAMFRSIGRYNSPSNLQGHQYRLLIGSKIIRQGLNFKAVRHQFVASLPTDYPTLMQVFGRVVRKDSHADLPPAMRDVNIRVFVSTYANNSISPELQRYVDKGKEFIVIQRVEKALHEYAIDGFVNYERIKDALGMKEEYVSSLNGMAYVPKVMRSSKVIDSTFLAYGYGDKEVSTIVAACRVLFKFRPVWTAKDLWAAVKAGLISKLYYDVNSMSEGNFTLALEVLKRPAGHPLTVIVNTGQYYIYSRVNPDGTPLIDVESYLREAPYNSSFSVEKKSTIKVSDFIKQARKGLEFTVKLREFDRKYLIEKETSIELSLVECNGDFHTELQRALISSTKKITSDDNRVIEMYKDFKICFTHEYMMNCKGSKLYRGSARTKPDKIVCYVSPEAAIVYDSESEGKGRWYNMSLADIGIHRRMVENDIVVGFTPSQLSSSQIKDAESRYKIRPPLHKIKNTHTDNRLIIKGAICSSRPREELLKHISGLRKMLQTYRAQLNPLWNSDEVATSATGTMQEESLRPESGTIQTYADESTPAARLDLSYLKREDPASKERFPSGNILCRTLCTYLLGLEQISRNSKKVDSLRWMYLYCDKMPVLGAIGAGEEDINREIIRPNLYDSSINSLVYN